MAKPPRKPAATADETKAQKFQRLGAKRVTKAVKAIGGIGNLAGGGYERTPAQVAWIREQLVNAVNSTLERFTTSGKAAAADLQMPGA